MNRHDLQLALRELSQVARTPSFWLGLLAVVLVLWISAPFDSGAEFSVFGRLIYWACVCVATYFPAFLVIEVVSRGAERRGLAPLPSAVIGGVLAGIPVGLTVFVINSYIAGNDDGEFKDVYRLIGLCTPIAVAVSLLQHLVMTRTGVDAAATRGASSDDEDRLMARLSPDVRGRLATLNAQDHYVEVVTDRGSDLILMRLADAIAETTETGMQVHRSWWVARHAVREVVRDKHRMELRLHDDRRVPVGRSRQAEVSEWMERAAHRSGIDVVPS